MQKFGFICVIGVFFLINLVRPESYTPEPCKRKNEKKALGLITDLQITPCPEFARGEPCVFTRGSTTAQIGFNFKHSIDARRLKNSMWWTTTAMDLQFSALKPNACGNTNCPVKANVMQPFLSNVTITNNLPEGNYPVKFLLKDRNKIVACFIFQIKLV